MHWQPEDLTTMTIITTDDHHRLLRLSRVYTTPGVQANHFHSLQDKLRSAKQIASQEIAANVITMNSTALIRDVHSGRQTEITVTYPERAAHKNGFVSIFSPMGLALLGQKERDVVSWRIPSGQGIFEIVKVIYQPEAAGHFLL
jgi:regulator of nucleoside diphosphate kinase